MKKELKLKTRDLDEALENIDYKKSWVTKHQLKLQKEKEILDKS